MLLIEILLAISALYSGGMYVVQFYAIIRHWAAFQDAPDYGRAMELHTFHLALCFILSLGFLGVLLRMGGQ